MEPLKDFHKDEVSFPEMIRRLEENSFKLIGANNRERSRLTSGNRNEASVSRSWISHSGSLR